METKNQSGVTIGSSTLPGMAKWKPIAIAFIVLLVIVGSGLGVLLWTNSNELNDARTSLAQSQSELAEKSAQLIGVSAQLADIQSKYPLRSFGSYAELRDWASANLMSYDYEDDLDEFNAAYSVAEEAMDEGLLVWVDFDRGTSYTFTYCCAFVRNSLYFWCVHTKFYDGVKEVEDLYRLSSSF
jgi:hypothetical protein